MPCCMRTPAISRSLSTEVWQGKKKDKNIEQEKQNWSRDLAMTHWKAFCRLALDCCRLQLLLEALRSEDECRSLQGRANFLLQRLGTRAPELLQAFLAILDSSDTDSCTSCQSNWSRDHTVAGEIFKLDNIYITCYLFALWCHVQPIVLLCLWSFVMYLLLVIWKMACYSGSIQSTLISVDTLHQKATST